MVEGMVTPDQYSSSKIVAIYRSYTYCYKFFCAVRNPPNPDDPYFNIAVSGVAARISRHLNNDERKFLLFAVQLVHQSDHTQLTNIQQSHCDLQDKCRRVLELWARRSESRWENVIGQLREIGLSRLADELTKELAFDRSIQPSASMTMTMNRPNTAGS